MASVKKSPTLNVKLGLNRANTNVPAPHNKSLKRGATVDVGTKEKRPKNSKQDEEALAAFEN